MTLSVSSLGLLPQLCSRTRGGAPVGLGVSLSPVRSRSLRSYVTKVGPGPGPLGSQTGSHSRRERHITGDFSDLGHFCLFYSTRHTHISSRTYIMLGSRNTPTGRRTPVKVLVLSVKWQVSPKQWRAQVLGAWTEVAPSLKATVDFPRGQFRRGCFGPDPGGDGELVQSFQQESHLTRNGFRKILTLSQDRNPCGLWLEVSAGWAGVTFITRL